MKDLSNWTEISKGFYRYVIGAKLCYEIIIHYHATETDILTAKSSLFLTGDWRIEDDKDYFGREVLLSDQPLFECLNKAVQDMQENDNQY